MKHWEKLKRLEEIGTRMTEIRDEADVHMKAMEKLNAESDELMKEVNELTEKEVANEA